MIFACVFAAAGLLLMLAGPHQALAGLAYDCGTACKALIRQLVAADAARLFPQSAGAPYRFESPDATGPCPAKRGRDPVIHAIVAAPLYRHFVEFTGTQNDAMLLKGFFSDRGVAAEFTHILAGDAVTRQRLLAEMEAVLPCVRERDQVVFVFTGASTSYDRWYAPGLDQVLQPSCAPVAKAANLDAFCTAMHKPGAEQDETVSLALQEAVAAAGVLIHFTSETAVNPGNWGSRQDARIVGLSAPELSNFVTQIRNRGADAFVVLDTNFAAATNLLQRQRSAVVDGGWSWNPASEETPTESTTAEGVVPLFGSGHMAAFYATDAVTMAAEGRHGDDTIILGNFIFALAESLRQTPDIALSGLALAVKSAMARGGMNQVPLFEASSTALKFLALRAAPQPRQQDIDVITPELKRGAVAIAGTELAVVARYTGAGRPSFANIDGDPVTVDQNGQFRKLIDDVTGKAAIHLRVYSRTNEQLAARTIQIGEARPEDAIAAGAGRYALIISNEDYAEDAFPDLATPKADGDAVARILVEKFGFTTVIDSAAAPPVQLRLENASKVEVMKALFDLRRRLTAEDQLVVYYAGHGENDPDLGAYWVPVDGQPNADFTWIGASEITDNLKRMNARSVLVISDSCYAGGLSRSGVEEAPPPAARERFLAKASRLKSRHLIASGR